ncbi:MAG: nucleoid occlusion factor SlmA [Pseudomonadales bacterium]|nr:nucleoid occlusion factor SlmA [Pseudomonadales bacterium]
MAKVNRRQQILEALALMLQNHPGDRITTANLAEAVGVSEAALYRHFPSKAKMLEGLIAFAEDTLFSRINMILSEQPEAYDRCRNIIFLILSFVERNPGFARLFVGDALAGETERLRARMHQLMNRVETQLRLVLREHNARQPSLPSIQINAGANLLLAYAEGRILQFVRSNFNDPPTKEWETQWTSIAKALFDS